MQTQASSVKCAQCGLINWTTDSACKRCHQPLSQRRLVQFAQQPAGSVAYIPHQWSEEKSEEWEASKRSADTSLAPTDTGMQQPVRVAEQVKQCPFCAETILAQAIKCRFCGEIVDVTRRPAQAPAPMPAVYQNVQVNTAPVYHPQPQRAWSPGVAAVLSFFIPGLGQLYKGQVAAGILWFFGVLIGYAMLIIPGLILHLICICAAASGDPSRQGG